MGIYKEKIPTEDKKLGRHIEHDDRSWNYKLDTSKIEIVDVEHDRFIPILNQGQVGACTGFAGIGGVGSHPFSDTSEPYYHLDTSGAMKLYSDNEILDGGVGYPPQDVGSSGLSTAKNLKKHNMISEYRHTFTIDDALKALTQYPIITGIRWHKDMYNPDPDGRVHPTGVIVGGHEIEAFKIDKENMRIWFYNSWGEQWGVKGTFYLTWEDYAFLLSERGDVTVLIPPVKKEKEVIYKTLSFGSRGELVKVLQRKLKRFLVIDGIFGRLTEKAVKQFQEEYRLVVDGIVGKHTWGALNSDKNSIIDIITKVSTANNIEPELSIAVATCESGLDPKATLYNRASNSTDRGLFQWNNYYHPEITDEMAFNPEDATRLFCEAVKQGHLHSYWSASQSCWQPKLSLAILNKYNIIK